MSILLNTTHAPENYNPSVYICLYFPNVWRSDDIQMFIFKTDPLNIYQKCWCTIFILRFPSAAIGSFRLGEIFFFKLCTLW